MEPSATCPGTAVLLMAHGSRLPEANADLHNLATGLRARGRYLVVEVSFLELAEPSIPAGAARCVEQGAQRVLMVPYFLSAGTHVRSDLAGLRAALQLRFPSVEFRLAEPLGPHPLLVEILAERARQAEG